MGPWESSYIQPGQDSNHLKLSSATWSGYEYVNFDVNGYNLGVLQLGPFPDLRVGLAATSDGPGFAAQFDNFKLVREGCPENLQARDQSGNLPAAVFETLR